MGRPQVPDRLSGTGADWRTVVLRAVEKYLAVSKPQQIALHGAARQALSEEEGNTLVALSPPANTDIATMQALEFIDQRTQAFT